MSDAIIISGAPYISGLNGSFYIVDPATTGADRAWTNSGPLRVFYENGWKLGNSDTGVIYFYQKEPSMIDPWNIPANKWDTDVEAYKSYAATIRLTRTNDADITTTDEYTRTDYDLTVDTVVQAKKTYYRRIGDGTESSPYTYEKIEPEIGTAIPEKSYYESHFVDVHIETTRNPRTGKTSVKTTESKIGNTNLLDLHRRNNPPKIEVGKVYRFSFVKDFQKLGYIKPTKDDFTDEDAAENDSDITRGVFKVDSSTNYYSLLLSGVDVYQNLYLPLGLSKDIYELDKKTWMNDDVWYRLVNPALPAQTYYVPTAIIEGIPDANVAEYKRYQLLTDIGIFNDPDLLTELLTCINMLFKAHFGIPTTSELVTYDSVWIPTSYADWMTEKRKENKELFMREKANQYYNTLFKTEYNELARENRLLQSKVKTYEEILTKV